MANRDRQARDRANTGSSSGGTATKDVFDTHGNDRLKDHIALQTDKKEQPQSLLGGLMSDSAKEDEKAKPTPSEQRDTVSEVNELLQRMTTRREELAGLLDPSMSREDQILSLIEVIAEDLGPESCEVLANGSYDNLTSAMVISSESEAAVDATLGVFTPMLGGFAVILFQMIETGLRKLPLVIAGEDEDEDLANADRMIRVLGPIISELRLSGWH